MLRLRIFQNKRRNYTIAILITIVVFLFCIVGKIQAAPIPVTSITSVKSGVSATISGWHFPAGQTFTVRMGPYGSYGVGGTVVGAISIDSSGAFTATYAIPSSLAGLSQVAIRFDGSNGFFSYNWFDNIAGGTSAVMTPTPVSYGPIYGYYGSPSFTIASVTAGSSVTVKTYNMPAQIFTVRMNHYGTLGVGGIVVGSTTNAGGSYSQTFAIPSSLAGDQKIAIRMDSPTGYYYAFNWFPNSSTGSVVPTATPYSGATATPIPYVGPVPGYYGVPNIYITAVVRDTSVTVNGYNLPAGQTFTVRMGPYGSLGIGGTVVGSYNSSSGTSFSATYSIPSSLAGSPKIAIRLETSNGYYNAYNWFWNNSTY